MAGRSIARLREEELLRRLRELEDEVKRLRGSLKAIRDWLEEVESQHAVVSLRLYELRLEVGGDGD